MVSKEALIQRWETNRPFADVVANIEAKTPEHQFRVLAVHDVQATLHEKGLEREPLKIIEVCNAGFAHKALQKDVDVSVFMPCRFVVYTEGGKTHLLLSRPSMIAGMLPEAGLNELASDVERTLKKIAEES
ncbi:MAG: DUF302 domain-containing protein, partial [Candidatus Zixiibacteriota bacterium]